MRRIKVLLTNDGRFHFDDIDAQLYHKLLKEGLPFAQTTNLPGVSYRKENLKRRLSNPEWWKEYLASTIKWAEESYKNCHLCHLQCGQNRFVGNGSCNAPLEGECFELFVHPEIEPGLEDILHIMMRGCSLSCFFCHKDQEMDRVSEIRLPQVTHKEVISTLESEKFKSVAFSGGNPDENILAILKVINEFKTFKWPILWETHGCIDTELFSKLSLIVDLFIITVKFGNDECALQYGGVQDYKSWITKTLFFLKNRADFLVRLSLIPGHERCCYAKSKEMIDNLGIRHYSTVRIHPGFNVTYKGLESSFFPGG